MVFFLIIAFFEPACISEDEIDNVIVMFTDIYGRNMGKRFDAEFFLNDAVKSGTHACDYLLACNMNMDPIPGFKFANWEQGYGDVHLVPDLATLRVAAWFSSFLPFQTRAIARSIGNWIEHTHYFFIQLNVF